MKLTVGALRITIWRGIERGGVGGGGRERGGGQYRRVTLKT